MFLRTLISIVSVTTTAFCIAPTARAADAATYSGVHGNDTVPYWGPGQGQDNIGYTFNGSTGFFFVPTADLEVSALGVMDFGAPGLESAHTIAIYENIDPNVALCVGCTMPRQITGDLVVEAVVADGMSGDFTSGWGRYIELPSSVVLEEGVEYYIVGDNFGCDPVAQQWFGYCDGADNSDQDLSVFGSTAVGFDARIEWTGYANAYEVADGAMWNLDESWQVPPGLGVNGNVGPTFWIEDHQCVHDNKAWARLADWPLSSLTYLGVTYDQTTIRNVLRTPTMDVLAQLLQSITTTDLNLANGSDPHSVQSTRNDALALVEASWGRPVSATTRTRVTALRATLDAYNSGNLDPAACEPVH